MKKAHQKAGVLCVLGVVLSLAGAWSGRDMLEPLLHVSFLRWTGYGSITFLLLSQSMTPLGRMGLLGANSQAAGRRDFGIASAFLATAHLTYAGTSFLDFNLLDEVDDSPWLQAGLSAWLVLLALWLTSYARLVSWLRLRLWKTLHRLAYVALGLAWLHLFLSPWADRRVAVSLGVVTLTLWVARLIPRRSLRRPMGAPAEQLNLGPSPTESDTEPVER